MRLLMENKKINVRQLRSLHQEIAPEPILKAPPPTPCISLKQRSGSVPDVRVVDQKKEKPLTNGSYYKGLFQTFSCSCKVVPKPFIDFEGKRSTSEHNMASGNVRGGPWITFEISPCTSNLLHTVRQRLMNL